MKKQPSAKQKANWARFAAMARAKAGRIKQRTTPMARKTRRSGGRRRGRSARMGLNTNAIIDGAIGAAGVGLGNGLLGEQYGPGVGLLAAGAYRHSETLQTLGGLSLGAKLLAGLSGATGGLVSVPNNGVL